VQRRIQTRLAASAHDIDVPVTWGAVRPVILLPSHSASWSEECLHVALLHETAHVRRLDWMTQIASRGACAVLWFHPLMWMAASRMREESENACDDLVMRAGVSSTDYAQRLVDIVRSMPEKRHVRTSAVAMAQPWEVERRLMAILARGRNRSMICPRRMGAAAAALTALLLPLAALRITTAEAATPVSQSAAASLHSRMVETEPAMPGTNNPALSHRIDTPPLIKRKRKMIIKPLLHTMIVAGLAAGMPPAHAQTHAVLSKTISDSDKSILDAVKKMTDSPSPDSDPAINDAVKTMTDSAMADLLKNTTDTVIVATTITLTDPQGKIVMSDKPSITLFPGRKGKIMVKSSGSQWTLEVSTTIAADKSILVNANLLEKALIDGATATYRPSLITKVGQKAAATISDEHGDLHFEITSILKKSELQSPPPPGTSAGGDDVKTDSPAHP
jgi:hypothetical protein